MPVDTRAYELRPLTRDDVVPDALEDPRPHFARATQHGGVVASTVDEFSLTVWSRGELVAYVVAALREVSDEHPMRALHLVQMVCGPSLEHPREEVLRALTTFYFDRCPELLTISINAGPGARLTRDLFAAGFVCAYDFGSSLLLELVRSGASGELAGSSGDGPPVVHFRTSSRAKWEQYEHLFRCYGMQLAPPPTKWTWSYDEPQVDGVGRKEEEILVRGPLRNLRDAVAEADAYPFVIEDTMLFIAHFNNGVDILPGPDTKRWWWALGVKGLLDLMNGAHEREARYVCQIGVALDRDTVRVYRAEMDGTIAKDAGVSPETDRSFPYANGTFFHEIFIPEGADRPYGRMSAFEFVQYDYRRRCVEQAAPDILRTATERPKAIEPPAATPPLREWVDLIRPDL